MINRLYSVFDVVAGEYSNIFPAKKDEVAIRIFKNKSAEMADPESYSLVCFGSFDSEKGEINLFDKVKVIIEGGEL